MKNTYRRINKDVVFVHGTKQIGNKFVHATVQGTEVIVNGHGNKERVPVGPVVSQFGGFKSAKYFDFDSAEAAAIENAAAHL